MKGGLPARERLLEQFPLLIQQQSLASLTLDQICQAAQAHRGSFYHAFENKQAWAEAGIEQLWANMQRRLDPVFSPSKTAWERLDAYVDLLESTQCDCDVVAGCPFFSLGSSLGPVDAELRPQLLRVLSGLRRYFESAVRDGQLEGSMREGNAAELAMALYHLIEGSLNQARIQQCGKQLHQLRQSMRWLLSA